MFLKVHLKVKKDAKSDPLERGGKGELFSAPDDVEVNANGTTTNAFEGAPDGKIEGAYERKPGSAPKG